MNRDVSIVLLWSVFSWHKYPASNISKHIKNRTPCRPHLVTRSVYLDVLPALWSVERFGDWQIPAMAGWVLSVRCGCARQGVKTVINEPSSSCLASISYFCSWRSNNERLHEALWKELCLLLGFFFFVDCFWTETKCTLDLCLQLVCVRECVFPFWL